MPAEPVQRTLVRFSFATDGAKGNRAVPNEYFLGRPVDSLTFGECIVSIPPGHKSGKVERPWSTLAMSLRTVFVHGYNTTNPIVLAAPDIDARVFEREVAPGIKGVGRRSS
jgi:esterase/lipase superfamily enzyme